jgi:hypothetical protein
LHRACRIGKRAGGFCRSELGAKIMKSTDRTLFSNQISLAYGLCAASLRAAPCATT